MHTFQGHEGDVGAVRVSPDGMNPRLAPTLELADYLTSRRVTDSKYFINNMMMTKSHM
ncbi:hypothetical protein CK203_062163 [Vitis vinifera]|uniref:Uncharacterized protein n=1 Tax=Vitis vinifera TaxID=29760 RepID=A0A438G902_VITVI|nr:hypothetical protein CK203_062163 [Vitis vinifera]